MVNPNTHDFAAHPVPVIEVDGDVLPPNQTDVDTDILDRSDPNAPHFVRFQDRDKLPADHAPDVSFEVVDDFEENKSDTPRNTQQILGESVVTAAKPLIDPEVRAKLNAATERRPAPRSNRHVTTMYTRSRGGL